MSKAKGFWQKAKNWLLGLLLAALCVGVTVNAVNLANNVSTKGVMSYEYQIGIVDEDGDVDNDVDTSIVMKNTIPVKGLDITVAEDADITYQISFYDADGDYISKSSDNISVDYDNSTVPTGAVSCRVEITPNVDKNGDVIKISSFDISKYAEQLVIYYSAK